VRGVSDALLRNARGQLGARLYIWGVMLNEIGTRIVFFLLRDDLHNRFVGGLVGEGIPCHTIRDTVRDYLLELWGEDSTLFGIAVGHTWETVATILSDDRAESRRIILDEVVDMEAVAEALIWESHKHDGEM